MIITLYGTQVPSLSSRIRPIPSQSADTLLRSSFNKMLNLVVMSPLVAWVYRQSFCTDKEIVLHCDRSWMHHAHTQLRPPVSFPGPIPMLALNVRDQGEG